MGIQWSLAEHSNGRNMKVNSNSCWVQILVWGFVLENALKGRHNLIVEGTNIVPIVVEVREEGEK